MDDFREEYVGGTKFIVPGYYQNLTLVDNASSSAVCQAVDSRSSRTVAIKKFYQPIFKAKPHSAYREISLLKHINHQNIIPLIQAFTPDSELTKFKDLYLVMPFVETLRRHLGYAWPIDEVKVVTHQILLGMKYLHASNIIHRDLKPDNIGIRFGTSPWKLQIQILDFGLARERRKGSMTGFVYSQWYRAPEIVTNWKHYCEKADIWSIGCITAELLLGHPLFQGDNDINQLYQIFKVVGPPSSPDEDIKRFLDQHNLKSSTGLRQKIPSAPEEATHLLEKMLAVNLDQRFTAHEALNSSFLQQFRGSWDEASAHASPYVEHGVSGLDHESVKKLIWDLLDFRGKDEKENNHMVCS